MIACDCEVCRSVDPCDKRLRSSILVSSASTSLVVDTGPDFRCQMLRAAVKKLDAVIFTHPHKDHVAGLDDIRAFNFFSRKAMPIYANEMTQEVLIREFAYAFADTKYPGVPDMELNDIGDEAFNVGDIPVLPVSVWHLRMPVLGFRFGDFTYITDANRIDPAEKDKIKGSKVLVLNALRKEKHISHFSLQESIELARELQAETTYLTHISHQMGLHQQVSRILPPDIRLAWDGLQLHIG